MAKFAENILPQRQWIVLFLVAGIVPLLPGCAGGETSSCQRLSQQQAATIESLNAEIVRLNNEINGTINIPSVLAKSQSELSKQLGSEIANGDLTLTVKEKGLTIRFFEGPLFEPESLALRDSAKATLNKIAGLLTGEFRGNKIILEGHTDGDLPDDSGWKSHWEYTNAMAAEVLHYFIDELGLDPARFMVVSCAEYQREEPANLERAQQLDRRVDIVIAPQKFRKGR